MLAAGEPLPFRPARVRVVSETDSFGVRPKMSPPGRQTTWSKYPEKRERIVPSRRSTSTASSPVTANVVSSRVTQPEVQ